MKNLGHNLKPDQLAECIDAVDGDGTSPRPRVLCPLQSFLFCF